MAYYNKTISVYGTELQFVQDRNIAYGVHVASLLRDISPATEGDSDQHENS